jgi:hypothetical protein
MKCSPAPKMISMSKTHFKTEMSDFNDYISSSAVNLKIGNPAISEEE